MPQNQNRVDWISTSGDLLKQLELIPNDVKFGSKPKYIIFIRGKYFKIIDGLNYPVLMSEIKKSYNVIDNPDEI